MIVLVFVMCPFVLVFMVCPFAQLQFRRIFTSDGFLVHLHVREGNISVITEHFWTLGMLCRIAILHVITSGMSTPVTVCVLMVFCH